jgi:hypothetical protein
MKMAALKKFCSDNDVKPSVLLTLVVMFSYFALRILVTILFNI